MAPPYRYCILCLRERAHYSRPIQPYLSLISLVSNAPPVLGSHLLARDPQKMLQRPQPIRRAATVPALRGVHFDRERRSLLQRRLPVIDLRQLYREPVHAYLKCASPPTMPLPVDGVYLSACRLLLIRGRGEVLAWLRIFRQDL